VRPILGIVGSAVFAQAIDGMPALQNAKVSSRKNLVIGVIGDDSHVAVFDFASARLKPVSGAAPSPDLIALSPGGTSALLYSSGAKHVQIFSGLPDAQLVNEFDVPGALAAMAVSDDGQLALFSVQEPNGAAIYSVNGVVLTRLGSLASASQIEFALNSHDAVVLNAAEGSVASVRESGEMNVVARAEQPSSVALSEDGRRVFVASSALKTITRIDVSDGSSNSVSCSCAPDSLERLAGDSVFRLTKGMDGPMWVLDGGGTDLRIAFIPRAGGSNE
jgi:streptogramin lyase